MKRHIRLFASSLLIVTILLMLSACGASLQKPTGLEPIGNEQSVIESIPSPDDQQQSPEELVTDVPEELVETPQPNNVVSEKPVVKTEEQPEATTKEKQPEKSDTTTAENDKKSPAVIVDKKQPVVEQENPPVVKAPVSTEEKPVKKPVEKPIEQPAEKPATKPAEKPVDKPTATSAEKPIEKAPPAEPAKSTIVYSIVISSGEVPLPPTTMEIKDGDTVLAALIAITKKHKVQMDYRGGQGATAYIEGMGNVYEFDRGQGSGWMYRVNGVFPDRGAGVVPLQDGDRVEWLYTTNLGVDLNADLKPFRR